MFKKNGKTTTLGVTTPPKKEVRPANPKPEADKIQKLQEQNQK